MKPKGIRGRHRAPALFIGTLMFLLVVLLAGQSLAGVKQLSMGTATVGGIFYNIGSPLAQCVNKALPEVNITAEFTQGTTENLRLIDQKKMQLAVITPMIGTFARKGIKMFKGHPIDFRVIARLLPNANVWVVLAKSKVKSIPELKGHKVGVGPASGGLGVIARSQLAANGINFKKDIKPFFMGAGDMAEALKDGAIEGAFLTMELAQQVAATHKIKPLSWREQELKPFLEKNPYYGAYTHPPGTFKGVNYPVTTVDNGIQWVCQVDMDEELVYKLTKAFIENLGCISSIYAPAKAITPQWAVRKLGNPYHPGAIRYYKEKGLWKD
ncbi:MAG: TAXI family TRAP transporter solute-binding subunit [Deltaproteobacteria bacterium]|nr:TAXI family TRAP transporter solute-binding subunit [Deltaproteobacteria bacterium]MBW2017333.1 TAXI family TRAP transporter solute-binding subunit [Deltaproteobacteria bacterium]MBW2129118.1 TAXI family TRAP transporter solute-binding subunit [Deltaproteobacteria bacterium]